MSGTRGVRAVVALATVAGAVLVAPRANAGSYGLDAHIDGCPNGGNYTPTSFHWIDMGEVQFTHTTDNSTAALMHLADSHQEVGNAVLHQTLNGTATITLAMSGVHIEAVREEGGSNGPEETIVLRFRQVTYTFQPLLPNGLKNGPPVTFTWGRR
jgi:type VI protein secretion system component Hcp